MIFAGIDVNIITHEKALSAGVEALGLWTWGMCYSQLHETDGRLPRVAVMSALGDQRRVLRRLVVRLVSSGLWIESECGLHFTIWNYGKKNQTADEIKAKKQASADRVRRWRERRNAAGNADVTPEESVRTDPPSPPPPENTTTTRKQEGESAPAGNAVGVSRVLRPDEPLTEQRRADHASNLVGPPRDTEAEWRNFVDDRIARTVLFASNGAVDADWRKWVRRQNIIDAKSRIQAQNDTGGKRRGRADTRQPLRDPNPEWLATGTEDDL
jgi:hypothetical protein